MRLPYKWEPRRYQLPAWQFYENGGKRGVAVWHRRAGKDLFGINLCAVEGQKRVGLYWHLFPTYNQGRKIAWQGKTKTGRPFLDYIPDELIRSTNNTEMRKEFHNGSIYQVVGTDNVDRLVGANPVGVIFSEWALMDPRAWDLIRPILVENEGWAFFIYTARGHNHGYTLYNIAKKLDYWFAELLTVEDTMAVSLKAVAEERDAGMPEELIQQEFYCSFEAAMAGSYYGEGMQRVETDGRVRDVPWDPLLSVSTWWDLGINDNMVIWFVQISNGREIRLIDYYENSGEGLPHYAKYLRELPYDYGTHYAPHDINVRELSTGRSRLEIARELGIRFQVVPKLPVSDGIEAVRSILSQCYFDKTKCERGINALKEYRKEYDDKLQSFKDHPVHDWSSHPADAFRIGALGIRDLISRSTLVVDTLPRIADDQYGELSSHDRSGMIRGSKRNRRSNLIRNY